MKFKQIIIIGILLPGALNAQEQATAGLLPDTANVTKTNPVSLRSTDISDLEDMIYEMNSRVKELEKQVQELEDMNMDVEDLLYEYYRMNPALRNSSTHKTGYLVGVGYNSGEIRETNVSIEDVYALIQENELLKRQIADLTKLYVNLSSHVELRGFDTALPTQFNLYVEHRNLVIENAQGELITVYRTDGTIVKNCHIADSNIIYIPVDGPNIYTVQVGVNVTKVVVP